MGRDDLTNIDVALLALLRLGGHERKVPTEEVAFEAYNLAKERFGWRLERFREMGFPDKEPVRSALMDAVKLKYGSLVVGRAGKGATGKDADGWRFTPQGAAWIRDNEQRIAEKLGLGKDRPDIRPADADRFRRQLTQQPLYRKHKCGLPLAEMDVVHFTEMLGCSPDAPRSIMRKKLDRLRATAELVHDGELIAFLAACSVAFSRMMEDSAMEEGESDGKA